MSFKTVLLDAIQAEINTMWRAIRVQAQANNALAAQVARVDQLFRAFKECDAAGGTEEREILITIRDRLNKELGEAPEGEQEPEGATGE